MVATLPHPGHVCVSTKEVCNTFADIERDWRVGRESRRAEEGGVNTEEEGGVNSQHLVRRCPDMGGVNHQGGLP